MDVTNTIIIFPNDTGSVTFVYPAPNCGLTLEQIAQKDVPAGIPYKFLPQEQVPTDHTFFNAFEADFTNPDGYGIGHDAWYAQQEVSQ